MKVRYTVPSDASRISYVGNGSTQVFPIPFVFFDDTDIQVTLVNSTTAAETPQVLTTNFTVSGGEGETGSVTMLVAPATGYNLVIVREIPYTQEIDYQANDGFPADVNEEGLDRSTMLAQQVRRRAQQSPKLPETFDPDSDDPISIPLPESGKILMGKGDGSGWINKYLEEIVVPSNIPVSFVDGPVTGDALVFDGGAFTNARIRYHVKIWGVKGDGTTDDTVNLQAAFDYVGALGGVVVMDPDSTFYITDELFLRGAKLHGDGTQTFKQYTINRACFRFDVAGSEIHDVNAERVPSRTNVITAITQAADAEFTCAAAHGLIVGNPVYFSNIAGMVEFNQTAHNVKAVVSSTKFTVEQDSTGYTPYTSGGNASFRPPSYLGFSGGWQRVAGAWLESDRAKVVNFNVKNFFTCVALRGPVLVDGASPTGYDNRPQADGLEIRNVAADGCDFVVTGSQYKNGIITGLTSKNTTHYTVDNHIIYLQNPQATGGTYEGFCSNLHLSRIDDIYEHPFGEAIKLSNMKDCTLTDSLVDGNSGITWSHSFRTKTNNVTVLNIPASGYGARITDTGDTHYFGSEVLFRGATGASFTGVSLEDANTRIVLDGVDVITDFTTVISSAQRAFIGSGTSESRIVNCGVTHLQSNNSHSFGASGTATMEIVNPYKRGSAGFFRSAAGTTTYIAVDPNRVDGYDPSSTVSINNAGTLDLRQIATYRKAQVATNTLIGASVAGTQTYSDRHVQGRKDGDTAFVAWSATMATKGGTMSGEVRGTGLPFTVFSETVASSLVPAQAIQCVASGLTGIGTASAVYAELIPGTTQCRFFWNTYAGTGHTRNYLTDANITGTSAIAFAGFYAAAPDF